MYFGPYCKKPPSLRVPRLRFPMLLLVLLFICVKLAAQQQRTITLNLKNAPLEKIFKEIKKQTGYSFVYRDSFFAQPVKTSITVSNATLEDVMNICLKDLPLTYQLVDNLVIIVRKTGTKKTAEPSLRLKGRITDQSTGTPLEGATVTAWPSGKVVFADPKGLFEFADTSGVKRINVSFTGYSTQQITVTGNVEINIRLLPQIAELDEVVQIAYGTTSKRYSTGSVTKISASDIEKQPVSNPLAALEGRVPGMLVTQTTGVPGSAFKVQVRGQNSLAQGSNPLFVIDGVPFAPGNTGISQIASAVGIDGISPFSLVNPADIASIEVLKDADATAIYGSRGANGVVLITTKKAVEGKSSFNISVYTSASKITRYPQLLNTQEYLQMRNEAFSNDRVTPTITNAPDLLVYDTTRYTDFKKMFIGGTAHVTDVQASYSAGSQLNQFLLGGNYHHETTVFPGDFSDSRGGGYVNVNHKSLNKKFTAALSASYTVDKNIVAPNSLASRSLLPPDYPAFYDSLGNLNWYKNGVNYDNPMALLQMPYTANTEHFFTNLVLGYEIVPGLQLKVNLGYNTVHTDEYSAYPISARNPANSAPRGSANFGSNAFKGWIAEPQLLYDKKWDKQKISLLLGGTFQDQSNNASLVTGNGYTSDALIGSIGAAGSVTAINSETKYRYQAVFGRATYTFLDRYIVNLSARRDGSSRFGPGKQFANFGSIGAAWIFTSESFLKNKWLSFGKLRASYGTTGNDQIGDYQYLESWGPTTDSYQGTSGIYPLYLYNPIYSWEVNKKLEIAMDLSFIQDKIMLTADYFYNRCGDQLINYNLPTQTGFSSIIKNFPAVVQNTGVELTLSSKLIDRKKGSWKSTLTLTIPQNKLASFQGIENSSYAHKYVVGQPLSVIYNWRSLGVDPNSGVYKMTDKNKDGVFDYNDYFVNGYTAPKFYGGFLNDFSYRKWQLSIFFEFRKQTGPTYQSTGNLPGTMNNVPAFVMDHWRKQGDTAPFQMFSTTSGTLAYNAQNLLKTSGGAFGDASFIRLKNVQLSYLVNKSDLGKSFIKSMKFFMQGQNLWTITNYLGADPETQSLSLLPPLCTIAIGGSFTF